ncbi:hypothetical protein IAT38_000545 [Cryptococcus sp. DSM 104549]
MLPLGFAAGTVASLMATAYTAISGVLLYDGVSILASTYAPGLDIPRYPWEDHSLGFYATPSAVPTAFTFLDNPASVLVNESSSDPENTVTVVAGITLPAPTPCAVAPTPTVKDENSTGSGTAASSLGHSFAALSLALVLCIVAAVVVLASALESSVVYHERVLVETLMALIYTHAVVNNYLKRAAEVINDIFGLFGCLSPAGALLTAVYVLAITPRLAMISGSAFLALLRELLKFDEVMGWKEPQVWATPAAASVFTPRTIVLRLPTHRHLSASAFDSSAPLPSPTTPTPSAELAALTGGSSVTEANCATLTGSASSPLQDDALTGQVLSECAEEANCATLAGSASSSEAGVEVGTQCATLTGSASILSSTDGEQEAKVSGEDEEVVEKNQEVEAAVEKEAESESVVVIETSTPVSTPTTATQTQQPADEPVAIDDQEHTATLQATREVSAPEYRQVKRRNVYTPKGQTYREIKSDFSDSDDEADTDACSESDNDEEWTAEEMFRLVCQDLRCITSMPAAAYASFVDCPPPAPTTERPRPKAGLGLGLRRITSLPASFIDRPPPAPTTERPFPVATLGSVSKKMGVVGRNSRWGYRNTALIPDSDDEDGDESEEEL